jgi:hypothetical protein
VTSEETVRGLVSEAQQKFRYFRRRKGRVLVRQQISDGSVHRLVDGEWVRAFGFRLFEPSRMKEMNDDALRNHVRRYIVVSLTAPALGWDRPIRRGKRGAIWRWLVPPTRGGTSRRSLDHDAVERSRTSYERILRDLSGADLVQVEEQATMGLEHQRQRGSGAEQRANFFLGAAGLTTTLILTNVSFLIGDEKLDDPWLAIAAGVLAIASICALVCGGRALQAAMLTFSRTPPNAVTKILSRRELRGDELRRAYVASVLVAQARATVVGDWKIARLGQAREWFLGVILGAVGLSACVLFGALL